MEYGIFEDLDRTACAPLIIGHGDVLMGLIATNNDELSSSIDDLLSGIHSIRYIQ